MYEIKDYKKHNSRREIYINKQMEIIGGTAIVTAISSAAAYITLQGGLFWAGFSAAGPVAGSAAAAM